MAHLLTNLEDLAISVFVGSTRDKDMFRTEKFEK